jgi:hypothetical protein
MTNVKRFPSGLDHQGRHQTRDTASRQIAAEQPWVRAPRLERRKTRAKQFCKLLVLVALAWPLLYAAGVLVAAMVAS